MDNEALKLIARLKIQASRAGLPVDMVRFAADRNYARTVLTRYSDVADEAGITLALQLMDKLGYVAATPSPMPAPTPEAASVAPSTSTPGDSRYVGRLR